MGEKYIFLGFESGSFTPEGETAARSYNTLFVMRPAEARAGTVSSGYRADKLRCREPVWNGQDLDPFDEVAVHFDRFGRVMGLELVKKYKGK